MAKKKEKYSPMMTKYLELKKDYEDAIVFYRLSDFYEMFFDDAITASKELNLALTGKNAGVKERVPMCGVPFHSATGYIEELVNKGYKVVIVEQLEDPKQAKGLVERGVVQIVTPGTIMDLKLNEKVNHFIGALGNFDFNYTLAYADISTGEFYCMNLPKDDRSLRNVMKTLDFKEVLVMDDDFAEEGIMVTHYHNEHMSDRYKKLFDDISDLKEIKTAVNLLNYMLDTQKRDLDYIQPLVEVNRQDYMIMDASTKKSLELTKSLNGEKYGSLLWLLDHTHSAMGGRMLKNWIDQPLLDEEKINERLDLVGLFVDNFIERETISDMIKEVYDLEKLASRIAFGNVNARDLKWIASSLKIIPDIRYQLESLDDPRLNDLAKQLVDLSPITDLIDAAIIDNPPLVIKEGNIIKAGYSDELDEYRDLKKNGQKWLSDFEEKEKEKTGISKLKIGYNRVFGYYIEVTKSQLNMVKDEFNYTRKQSLSNAERFITPELKEMETKILSAQDRIVSLEYEIFTQVRNYIKQYVHMIQDVAKVIARVDCYTSLAALAAKNGYVRPTFNHDHRIDIVDGRHPVVEEVISRQNYIANDCHLDQKANIMLITGPNMGGKSTYMRQVVLTAIMAQIGSFVPAKEANLPIFDQIFTRIGASDDLVSGQSTFMVEMLEANNALRYATEDSLIIFDEIGRGTATYDGMAIAQGMIDYIAHHIHALTLFSTHYHELTLMNENEGVKNVHASADVSHDTIHFLYKIKPGATGESYGINVAKLAQLPEEVIATANNVLKSLDTAPMHQAIETVKNDTVIVEKDSEVEKALEKIDPMKLSPIDALSTLIELKKLL